MRVQRKYLRAKSDYYWLHRNYVPTFLRFVADKALGVDSSNALVDRPTKPSQSVRVMSVVVRTNCSSIEAGPVLSERLRELDDPGAPDAVVFSASDLCNTSASHVLVDVRYRGHSNPQRKMPAREYMVRYGLSPGEVARFPPYGLRERQKKGFGVKKIKSATVEGYNNLDVTVSAQTWVGPRNNFYADCEDMSVVKNFIDLDCDTVVTYGGGTNSSKILLHPYMRVE